MFVETKARTRSMQQLGCTVIAAEFELDHNDAAALKYVCFVSRFKIKLD